MSGRLAPSARIIVTSAFLVGLGILVLDPLSWGHVSGVMKLIAGSIAVVLVAALAAMLLGRGEMPEEEFQRIAKRRELLATLPPGQVQPSEFEEAVVEAINELPDEFQDILKDVPIVISDLGHQFHAYGHY